MLSDVPPLTVHWSSPLASSAGSPAAGAGRSRGNAPDVAARSSPTARTGCAGYVASWWLCHSVRGLSLSLFLEGKEKQFAEMKHLLYSASLCSLDSLPVLQSLTIIMLQRAIWKLLSRDHKGLLNTQCQYLEINKCNLMQTVFKIHQKIGIRKPIIYWLILSANLELIAHVKVHVCH